MVYAPLLVYCGLLGGTGMLAGAYGAHGLKTEDAHERLAFVAAAQHQVLHSVAALASVTLAEVLRPSKPAAARRMTAAASLFLFGITVSAGTRYALSFGAPPRLRRLGPLGGLTATTGWFCAAFAALAL
ncbi:hypothetical protein NESM_000864300 [Novymonas esmeraldas]|uniref:DUF423 domain-containing protein n=1 Tax=Novymonas esmeraldas TaxID=1808958 RepID=A0AAW0EYR1_9TRYP